MDNEMKNMENTDEIAEFEIPDISAVSEELGINDERAERSEPKPKRSRKKKTESKADEGEWAMPTEDGPDAEHKPKRKKRKPKKKPREEIAISPDTVSGEGAGTESGEADEVIAEDEAIAEGEADTEIEADNKPEAVVEDEPVIENEAVAEVEADAEGDTVAEDEDIAEAEPAIAEEAVAEDEVIVNIETSLASETEPEENVAADTESSDIPDAESSDTKEDEIPVFVPREYKFPDDALSPSMPTDEDFPVIDLLGDPLTDEVYVAEEMRPALPSDSAILPEEESEGVEDTPKGEEKYDPEKPRKIDVVFDFVELVIFTLAAVLFFTTFFVKHAVVEGYSMYDTLYPNDVLLISDLFYEPRHGDIVVVEDYTLEREDMHKPLVKRVIATEGQLVMVTKNAIYVNGEMLDEPYVFIDTYDYEYNLLPSDELSSIPGFFANSEHYTFVVPEGEVFVMGDHRNDSTDSRHVGTIREEAILGRALIRIYPFSRFGVVDD